MLQRNDDDNDDNGDDDDAKWERKIAHDLTALKKVDKGVGITRGH